MTPLDVRRPHPPPEASTHNEAVRQATESATAAETGQIIVHRRDGHTRYEYTYGKDPRERKGELTGSRCFNVSHLPCFEVADELGVSSLRTAATIPGKRRVSPLPHRLTSLMARLVYGTGQRCGEVLTIVGRSAWYAIFL